MTGRKKGVVLLLAGLLAALMGVMKHEETVMAAGGTVILSEKQMNTEAGQIKGYEYDAKAAGYDSNRTDIMSPDFYIFAGGYTQEEAEALVTELDMMNTVQKWAGYVMVVNPVNGDTYGEQDAGAFLELVNSRGPAKNVKVIGIEDGAAFVNNEISQKCYFISGMMIYGGEMRSGLEDAVPVPVYIDHGSEQTAAFYSRANEGEPLAPVVTGEERNLKEAFSRAWDTVLKKYYRIYDVETEFYSSNIMENTTPYELNEIVDFEELGIQYQTFRDSPVTGLTGKYTWYEYIPASVFHASNGTVPLVVSCHGNGNDPRIQGDTSGWPELAVKEGFMVISPEWQEADVNFTGCDGLGERGVMALIEDLKRNYPQIDASRIYVTGLSAGGAFSFKLGIKHSDVFAAAAPVAGVNIFADEIAEALNQYQGDGTPLIYLCGDRDFFQMIPVDGSSPYRIPGTWASDKNVHIFSALQAYQQVLGLEVTAQPDMQKNPYYGIALDHQRYVTLGTKQMYTGTLSDEEGVIMELGAILEQPHWNYKPQAEYIWSFMKNFKRDLDTRKIVRD